MQPVGNTTIPLPDAGSRAQLPRFLMLMRHELRLLMREKIVWISAILFVFLVAYAVFNGIVQTQWRDAAQAELVDNDQRTRAAQLAQLQRIVHGEEKPTPFGNPANPANLGGGLGGHYAIMPSTALTPMALGQSDLFPSQFKISVQSKIYFINNNEIENPWHLLSGHFDLAFVIIYLLPLVIFAIGYNLLAGEREDGTLKLLLSQPLALMTVISAKIMVRAGGLLSVSVLVPLLLLASMRPQILQYLDLTAWWALMIAAYAFFWCMLVVFFNLLKTSSASNAMALMVSWVVIVLVCPVLLNIVVSLVNPAPSRAELATRTRVATAAAMEANAKEFATDYDHMDDPERLRPHDGQIEISARPLAYARLQRQVDEMMQPELDKFDQQMVRRQELVRRYSMISPAAMIHEGMSALAGTGQSRYAHFMQQIDQYHHAWKDFFLPRIEQGKAVMPEDFPHLPVFHWQEEPVKQISAQALECTWKLLLPSLLLLGLSFWRLRHFKLV